VFTIILYQPEIPPNTGNVIRLCANIGASLHLIEPLGFTLDDKNLQRAGLDYHSLTNVTVHPDLAHSLASLNHPRLYALSTKGKTVYSTPSFQPGDAFIFGSETKGLPITLLESLPPQQVLTLPQVQNSRSLNLSNAVAIMAYEAWRQCEFSGATALQISLYSALGARNNS
jgi:tRNA (cytidine/uridine-2'-O-)-methyltransferase